ncbi:hypothetical protein BFJ65_g14511 [Fusarium oxysporum f. sp. cepae]|uniref:Uncharacterized protein n=1 Tax=Fusarium oxysporum f. sp. cepae TaxID=396571 RepID=A0A3L6N1S5_FUSOX|nr:hypothetical protein BFJ65_g14511 [Fusarium oxysporum f. sp. cepae]RKK31522.1 hypothetical protein BFJ67_g15191 [Fusarium oxysporum f. sp. cepae]
MVLLSNNLPQLLNAHILRLSAACKECAFQSLIYNAIANVCSHNQLPIDDVLLKIEDTVKKHVPQLKLILKQYGVKNFAVCVQHRHFKVPDGFNMVGRVLFQGLFYFTRKVANDKILGPGNVCGRKFIFDKQYGWRPCEFHEGSAPDLSKVAPEFFIVYTTYLVKHDLTSIFGLEYTVPGLLIFDILEIGLSDYGLLYVDTASMPLNDAQIVTTRFGLSGPIHNNELRCIRFPEGHRKVNVDQQESDPSDDEVIIAFKKEYPDAALSI